jgi:hypothetical protein
MKQIVNGVEVDLTAQEIAEIEARQAQAKTEQEEWEAGASDRAKAEVRADRDTRLASTDWTASSDLKMSDEMKTYRQALRDVPAQENFPDVTWPEFTGEPLAPVEEEAEEEAEEETTEETTEESE